MNSNLSLGQRRRHILPTPTTGRETLRRQPPTTRSNRRRTSRSPLHAGRSPWETHPRWLEPCRSILFHHLVPPPLHRQPTPRRPMVVQRPIPRPLGHLPPRTARSQVQKHPLLLPSSSSIPSGNVGIPEIETYGLLHARLHLSLVST